MSDHNLKTTILEDLKNAMKSGDKRAVSVLRMLNSEIKNKEIEKGRTLSDDLIVGVITSQAKKRKDSITAYKEGGREDLAEQEEKELDILKKYLPEQMNEEKIRKEVENAVKELNASGASDIGKVMGFLTTKLKGKADNSVVSKIAKEELEKLKSKN